MLKRRTLIHHGILATTAPLALGSMNHMNHGQAIGRGHPTISKSQADYQNQPNHGYRCAACCMFVPGRPAHCTMVDGIISQNGWCKYWQAGPNDTCS